MIYTSFTHHLVQITAGNIGATADDAALGIVAQQQAIRWQGDVQAYLQDQTTEEVRGGESQIRGGSQRITVYDTMVTVPANLPVWPLIEDILTLTRKRDNATVTYRVRKIDDKWVLLGQLKITCRVA